MRAFRSASSEANLWLLLRAVVYTCEKREGRREGWSVREEGNRRRGKNRRVRLPKVNKP